MGKLQESKGVTRPGQVDRSPRATRVKDLTAAATLDSRQCECNAREPHGDVPATRCSSRAPSAGEERQGIVDGTCFPVATAHRVGPNGLRYEAATLPIICRLDPCAPEARRRRVRAGAGGGAQGDRALAADTGRRLGKLARRVTPATLWAGVLSSAAASYNS